jgi:hypothetical protein
MRRTGVLVAVLVLCGCWLQPQYGPSHQNFNPFETHLTAANVGRLSPVWRTTLAAFGGQPLASGRAVYMSGATDESTFTVESFERGSGALLWRRT